MKQKDLIYTLISTTLLLMLSACDQSGDGETNAKKTALGAVLFNDTNLSLNRTISCASCHDLGHAMVDSRPGNAIGASRGDDGIALGDRNAPTAAYAAYTPSFHFNSREGLYIGGQFHDGRAEDLKAQAKGPFLNPLEMMMPDESSVIERVKENSALVARFESIYGEQIFDSDLAAYDALAESIALFEMSPVFAPFDAKYDRHLAGEADLTPLERQGLQLFEGKALCSACHPATTENGGHPLFTDHTYDNLGVPVNMALRDENGVVAVDNGLGGRTDINDPALNGAFKVATLRNIAVTGPYMHNGIFKELKTVVHFYNTRDVDGAINPETNSTWELAEVDATKNSAELGNLGLSDAEEEAIVAFLMTLTDKRYEPLIPAD